jgi:hypothetical protein
MNKKIQKLVPNDFLEMIREIKKEQKSNTVVMHQGAFGEELDELLMLGASIKWANINSVNITIISDKQETCETL